MRNERRLPQETTPEGPPMESTAARRVVSRPAPRVSSNSGLRGSKRDPAPKVTVDDVVSRLEGAKAAANGSWSARCPAHEDGSPSLSVRAGDHGGVIVKCHAGCSFDEVCAALGYEPRQLCGPRSGEVCAPGGRREPQEQRPPKKRRIHGTVAEAQAAALASVRSTRGVDWRLVAQHRYRDLSGAELMRALRFEPPGGGDKTIRPIHARDDGWALGDPDGLLPLYRLDSLRFHETVYVVEGEKAADAGASIGLNVTTSAHGASSAAKSDWAPIASGSVVLMPDNDEPGSAYVASVCARLRQLNPEIELRVLTLPELPQHGDLFDFVAARRAGGRGEDQILSEIHELASAAPRADGDAAPLALSDDSRPVIRIEGGDAPQVVDAAESALLAGNPGRIFTFGDELVRVDARVSLAAVGTRSRIIPMTAPNLCEEITRATRIERLDRRSGEYRPVDLPDKFGVMLLHRRGRWRAPELVGITRTPTLRADGSVLAAPGYDAQSRLLFDHGGVEFPSIPEQPTREQALESLARVESILSEFPFVCASDKSAALSMFLTAAIRRSLPTAPLFAIRAPKMASGKSLLARTAGYLMSGELAGVVTLPSSSEERRKLFLALLLENEPVIVLDNIIEPLEDESLCSILTESRWRSRVLGVSRSAIVPTNALWIATGNNLVIRGDLTTRVVPCDLDPNCERPEEREFTRNLDQWMAEHWREVLVEALTVLRAYAVAGCPPQNLPPFGRFEDWSRRVREPLVWLGLADPTQGRRGIEDKDPEREVLREVLQAWAGTFGTRTIKVADVARQSHQLRELFLPIAPGARPGELDAHKLGMWIARFERRIEGGLRFERSGSSGGSATWRVVHA